MLPRLRGFWAAKPENVSEARLKDPQSSMLQDVEGRTNTDTITEVFGLSWLSTLWQVLRKGPQPSAALLRYVGEQLLIGCHPFVPNEILDCTRIVF